MRRYIMLMLVLPCLAMAQGQAGLYRLMAGAASGSIGITRDGLMAEYLFTSDASDTSGNGYNGVLTNGATASGVLDLDGIDDFVYFGSVGDSLVYSNMTFSLWVNNDDTTDFRYKIAKLDDIVTTGEEYSYRLFTQVGNLGFNITSDDGTLTQSPTAISPVLTDTWYHFVAVYNGTQLVSYTDGELVDQEPFADGMYIGTGEFVIGARYDDDLGGSYKGYHDGELDNIRIYNRAITTDEIDALYNEGHD